MKIKITSVKRGNDIDYVEITAIVQCPSPLSEPKVNKELGNFEETDEQYRERVKPQAEEIDCYDNLHIGWGELKQKVGHLTIPHMEEYWS
jgi:hypothetical protein